MHEISRIKISDQEERLADTVSPHSIEAEQSVLGALMLDNNAWELLENRIEINDFYHPAHQKIFSCIASLAANMKPVDALTVSEAMKLNNYLESCGGSEYLAELAENMPNVANIKAYADIVYERSMLRSVIQIAKTMTRSSYQPEGLKHSEIVETAERDIFQMVNRNLQNGGPVAVKVVLKKTLERIEDLFSSQNALTGVSTGFHDLDTITSGLQASEMVIVAARPSMGKTVLGMNLVEGALMRQPDKVVVVFSLEMPAEHILLRTLASLGKINQTRLRTGQLEENDWPKLALAVKQLKEKKLFIDDTPGIGPQSIRLRLRRIIREHGAVSLVMVDYLQLMQIIGHKEGRISEISEISRSLKAIAREFNVPLVALSQLNRSLEQRPNKRPINSDLRESGAIEQDADLIMFIYRDEVYNPDTEHKGIAEIIIGKQRNGPIGTVRLAFMGQYACFSDLAQQHWEGVNS